MTQEERAEMLALMQEAIKPLQGEMANMRGEMANMRGEMANMQGEMVIMNAKQGAMDDRLTAIEMKIENETDRAIQALSEGYGVLGRKLEEKIGLESRVEVLEHKISAVEYTLKQAK